MAGEQRKEWILTTTIVPVITLRQKVIDVGSRSERTPSPEHRVEVDADPLVKEIRCDASVHWSARVTREPRAARGTRFSVLLTPAGNEPRTIDDTLTIIPVGEGGRDLPGKQVRLRGEVLPDVNATPGSINAGRRRAGSTITEWVRVHSLTGRPFTVAHVETSEGLSARREDSQPHELYRLEHRAEGTGERSALVSFHVRDENGHKHKIRVVLRYEAHHAE